jgi:O-antigen/teichoic acid export membrane protein
MAPDEYAVWVLVLQTSAYISFLNLGLQTAVGRYVAYANEKHDHALRDSVVSTAFAGLCCAAILSIGLLLAIIYLTPAIFPSVPASLMPQMRLALFVVGLTMAIELPASAWNGVFAGLQRYEIPALTIGGARLIWAIGVIVAAFQGRSIVVMATILAGANILSYLAQYLALRRVAPDIHFRLSLVRRSTARELAGYCFGLIVMSLSMILISGFDLLLVGHFQFSAVTPYSVAASMITLMSGMLYAVINVIMPHAATLHAAEKAKEMGMLVLFWTRMSVLLLVATGAPILIYAGPIIHLWIGARYVSIGTPLLGVLIIGNVIRLTGAPYSIVLIAAGQQNLIKISPLAEGLCNFIVSVALGFAFGAIGIALGTLIGAFIGIATHLGYSMSRARTAIALSRRHFLVSGVLYPLLWTTPLLAASVASLCGVSIHPLTAALALILSLGGAAFICWRDRWNVNIAEATHP